MGRRHLPWILAVPMMAVGSISAHALGQRLFAARPDLMDGASGRETAEAVARSSHGAATVLPVIAGILVALALVAMVERLRGRPVSGKTPPGLFLLLPPLAYAIQEIAERRLHAESFAFNPAREPAFLAALALQLPFGWLAYRVAVLLRAAGRRVADVLSRGWAGTTPTPAAFPVPIPPSIAGRLPLLARGHPVRGPPVCA